MRRRNPAGEPQEVVQFIAAVGARIRALRREQGLTQVELAQRADISRLTLMAIERGTLASQLSVVARILWTLDDRSLQKVLEAEVDDAARA